MALSKITTASVADTAVHGRRRININGAMTVAQRGTSKTGVTTTGYYATDRMRFGLGSCGTWTVSQDANAPNGFANSHKILCTTAAPASLSASAHLIGVDMKLEAQDLQQLGYGTSDAKDMTLSFWVKSNKTGTASISPLQSDNSNKMLSVTYTIDAADTWEYKTVYIPADTSGVINDDNGQGMEFHFWLNSGSNYTGGSSKTAWSTFGQTHRNAVNLGLGSAVNDYWQITGLQLEVGEASPFEHRSFGEELALCQRYLCKSAIYSDAPANSTPYNGGCIGGSTSGYNSTTGYTNFTNYPVSMRAKPTITIYSANLPGNADGKVSVYDGGWGSATTTVLSNSEIGHALNIVDSWTAHNTIMYFYAYKAEAEL